MDKIPDIIRAGPDWLTEECPYGCSAGIKNAKDLKGTGFLYEDRAQQFKRGEIEFCDCIKGVSYRMFLENNADDIIEAMNVPTIRLAETDEQTMGSERCVSGDGGESGFGGRGPESSSERTSAET